MDDYTDDCFLFLAHAQRFYHVGIPIKPFAHVGVYGVGGNVVRVYVDHFAHFRNDGDFWEEGTFYCHAEILKEDRGVVCLAFSMEGNSLFYGIADYFPAFSKSGVARFPYRNYGIFVHPFAVFFQQTIFGNGNCAHR